MISLSERQVQILEALWCYQYLSSHQLSRIMGFESVSYVNKLLRSIAHGRARFVSFRDFGFHPRVWRLPRVYFLTHRGAKLLSEELGHSRSDIRCPWGQNALFDRDLQHRLATIDFHIQFRQWAMVQGHEEINFSYYFRSAAKALPVCTFETKLGNVTPDWVAHFNFNGTRQAFLFEQHNGSQSLRAVQQVQRHMQLLSEGWASEVLACRWAVSVFFVFENEACMKNTLQRLHDIPEFEAFRWYFSFRCHWESFGAGWVK